MIKKHVVKLIFEYEQNEEEFWHDVVDEDSAIAQAQKEIEEHPIHSFDFDYEVIEEDE